jgi:hypothetical protein
MILDTAFIKKILITIAYCAYVALTVAKNKLQLDIGNYEYIVVAVIGICLKLASSLNELSNIINNINLEELKSITGQLSDITLNLSQPQQTTRTLDANEPYVMDTPKHSETITHRDVPFNDNYVLRIHK